MVKAKQPERMLKAVFSPGRAMVILGTILVALGTIVAISYLHEQSDRSRRVQIAITRVKAQAHQIEAAEWQAMAIHQVTPEVLKKFDEARSDLRVTLTRLLSDAPADHSLDFFVLLCRDYLQEVTRELELVKDGRFEQARQLDAEEVDPRFDLLSRTIDELDASRANEVRATLLRSQVGLIAAAMLSTSVVLFLFLRFQRTRYNNELILAEQAALRKDEQRFRTLTEKSSDIIAITTAAGVIRYISPSVESILGVKEGTLCLRNVTDLIHPDDAGLARAALAAVVEDERNDRTQFRLRHDEGTWLQFECSIRNLLSDENIDGLVLNLRDVTARKKVEEELLFQESHDDLTKLPNRALFLDRLRGTINRLRRHPEQSAAVLFIDVDDFKMINDSLGHSAGDELIAEYGKRLKTCLREADTILRPHEDRQLEESFQTIARLGGDEFTVLLEEVREPSDAIRVAQRIQQAMEQPFVLRSHTVHKTASIGISLVDGQGSAEELLRNADIAMYRAKMAGKARCEIYDQGMHAQVVQRLQLESDLRRAIERKEFRLYYQPIISLATSAVVGFEALLRWERPGSGLVPPGEFIETLESTGLMTAVGRWILEEACRHASAWNRQSLTVSPLYVSANVSGKQLYHHGFLQDVKAALEASGLPPQHLKLELTEGVAMENAPRTEQILLQIKALGVRLSIDDFGTGYSSLSYLRRFPVDTLKIDRSFIAQMHTDKEARAIVTTIVALARSLGLEVVAEGVELLEQLEQLKQIVCDSGQGFLFSRPLPAEKVLDFLRSAQARVAGQGM